jgi:hypothetical protein
MHRGVAIFALAFALGCQRAPRAEPKWDAMPRGGCLGIPQHSTCTEDIGPAHDPGSREKACRAEGVTTPLPAGETCPSRERVGRCALDSGADVERHLSFYASGPAPYTTERARDVCTRRRGTFREP